MTDQVRDLLRNIDATAAEVFDLADREQARKDAGSRRTAYEKGLREVQRVAGKPQARTLAEWIQGEMRDRETFPSARRVRRQAADICRESGHDVSTSSWLGA